MRRPRLVELTFTLVENALFPSMKVYNGQNYRGCSSSHHFSHHDLQYEKLIATFLRLPFYLDPSLGKSFQSSCSTASATPFQTNNSSPKKTSSLQLVSSGSLTTDPNLSCYDNDYNYDPLPLNSCRQAIDSIEDDATRFSIGNKGRRTWTTTLPWQVLSRKSLYLSDLYLMYPTLRCGIGAQLMCSSLTLALSHHE